MTKLERLMKAVEGADLGLGGEAILRDLASGLASERVDQVATMLRAARRAGRADEVQARRRHREGRRRDPGQLAGDTERMVRSGLGRRAAEDLEALAALQAHYADEREVIALAVAGLRARHPDVEIGVALGFPQQYARQEMYRRFGARSSSTIDAPLGRPAELGL